jgi:hypothetical protein
MHGVNPYNRPRSPQVDIIREYLPLIGFALIPFAGLVIATAIQAGGFPTLPALAAVLTTVGLALGQF